MLVVVEQEERKEFIVLSFLKGKQGLGPLRIPIQNFDEFCDACGPDPVSALKSFEYNMIEYSKESNKMNWPDDVIEQRKGNCVDFAIFMHYFFQYHHFEHAIGFVTFIDKFRGKRQMGHAFPIFKFNNLYWIWNYFGSEPGYCDINGPFPSYNDIVRDASPYYSVLYNSVTKPNLSNQGIRDNAGIILNEDDLEFLDEFKNKRYDNIKTQNEILLHSPKIEALINDAEKYASSISGDIIDITPTYLSKYLNKSSIKSFFKHFKSFRR